METIKHKSLNKEDRINIFNVIGKPVFSKNNQEMGIVKEVHIHPVKLSVEGIRTRSSIFSEDKYIGKNYIGLITEKGVILKINPITDFVGLRVMDSEGKDIGKVKEVLRTRQTNSIQGIIVNVGFLKRDVKIPKSKIRTIGKKVMLNSQIKAK